MTSTYGPVHALVYGLQRDGSATRVAQRVIVGVLVHVARTHEGVNMSANLSRACCAQSDSLVANKQSDTPLLG